MRIDKNKNWSAAPAALLQPPSSSTTDWNWNNMPMAKFQFSILFENSSFMPVRIMGITSRILILLNMAKKKNSSSIAVSTTLAIGSWPRSSSQPTLNSLTRRAVNDWTSGTTILRHRFGGRSKSRSKMFALLNTFQNGIIRNNDSPLYPRRHRKGARLIPRPSQKMFKQSSRQLCFAN